MPDDLVREPVYQQLNQLLRGLMGGKEFREGERFLTERQICGRFGVSRATANKALSNLVAEGILEFRKGVGTFVRGGAIDYDLRSLVSFTEKARDAGRKPATRVLAFRTTAANDADPDAAAALELSGGEPVHFAERLRLAGGEPLIIERRHIAARHCPGLRRSDLAGSIYELWTGRYSLEIAGAQQTIRAVNVGGGDARLLRVRAGAAGLLVTSTGYLKGDRPLWFERTLYRGDAYEFRNRLGGLRTARPAVGALVQTDAAAGKS